MVVEGGSILLIHGSAPFHESGRVPDARAGFYADFNFYSELAAGFEKLGWKTVRYSKPGVSDEGVDFSAYCKTDLENISLQLNSIWEAMPSDRPRIVFAWSEGSLHVPLLPMKEIDGVILLGGISTNISEVFLWQSENKQWMIQFLKDVSTMPRDTMIGLDRPAGRLADECALPDNWRRFWRYRSLPCLVIHGEADAEVSVQQAANWGRFLPNHRIEFVLGKGRNHAFGIGKDHGAAEIVRISSAWLASLKAEYQNE